MTAAAVVSPDEPILEGIVVTLDEAGAANIAPMGPRVDRRVTRLTMRPFATSRTYRNLRASGCGVFHVTDDVAVLARAAVGRLDLPPSLVSMEGFPCPRLVDCCRWFAFRVDLLDDTAERTTIACRVVDQGEIRPFFGFNRAKHAVVEAAILATRIGILPVADIVQEMARMAVRVEKTAGEQERRAFAFLQQYIDAQLASLNSEP
jgi:hypothetical protein